MRRRPPLMVVQRPTMEGRAVSAGRDAEFTEYVSARLPSRPRATLVLRFYCALNVDQSARLRGCSPGTVKGQPAKALGTLRGALEPGPATGPSGRPVPERSRHSGEGDA